MDSIIRLSAAVNKVRPANPMDCLEEIRTVLSGAPDCDIAVFPRLALCGTCGELSANAAIIEQCAEALDSLGALTAERSSYILAGLVIEDCGRPTEVTALLYQGELIAYIPADCDAPQSGSEQLVPANTVFGCGGLKFCVMGCDPPYLALYAPEFAKTGCDLIIIPSSCRMYAGKYDEIRLAAKALSASVGCAVAIVNGGVGDTSSPWAYGGFVAVYECGEELAGTKADFESFSCTVDLDLDVIRAHKKSTLCECPSHEIRPCGSKPGLLRQVNPTPFLPKSNADAYFDELFSMQAGSLRTRMENIGISRLVVGVSGGLDSTAALLASAAAVDSLGLPRENIVAITMPGFGTSDHTYFNALSLIERLGATSRDISIRQSVRQHFEDIGHTGKSDAAYENAQARERAQILLDVANMVGGLVVGTGNMSEAALGFATFAGDHICNYNVNAGITKTALRAMVRHIADASLIDNVSDLLEAVLDTPVSPELLPAGESGEIKQKTEDILAPYELLDFFLYYFAVYHFRPSKILFYARVAFAGRFSPAYIKEKLGMFLQRFCTSQFKRACSPDSAALTRLSLSGGAFYIPSDLDPGALMRELEAAEI